MATNRPDTSPVIEPAGAIAIVRIPAGAAAQVACSSQKLATPSRFGSATPSPSASKGTPTVSAGLAKAIPVERTSVPRARLRFRAAGSETSSAPIAKWPNRNGTGGPDERIDRDDVLRITTRRTTHERSAKFAAAGAALGLVGGLLAFPSLAFKQCGGSCTDEGILIGLSIFGLPVAGGVLGWQLSATRTTVLIYERSA